MAADREGGRPNAGVRLAQPKHVWKPKSSLADAQQKGNFTMSHHVQSADWPIAPVANPITPGIRIGHIHLRVADLDRSLRFYCGVLGFELTQYRGERAALISAGGYHHHIALNTRESLGGAPPSKGSTGLDHFAILYPTRAALADAINRLHTANIEFERASDHGVSESVYARDPDGIVIELSWDRPVEQWPRTTTGDLAAGDKPLDLQDLLQSIEAPKQGS
jgi:catechol 2,3-dioxygenase